jgi:hypothetical protein
MSGFALERIPERKWRGVRPSLADGRFKAEIQCGRCGIVDTWSCGKVPEPATVFTKFRDRGWAVVKGQKVCPACMKAEREAKAMAGQQDVEAKATASVSATKAKMQAAALLESEFDVVVGRYRDGSSDKAIADTVGLSEQAIVDLRNALGIVIRERPEVAALRKDIESCQTRLLGLDNDLRRFDRIIEAEMQRVAELSKRLEALA